MHNFWSLKCLLRPAVIVLVLDQISKWLVTSFAHLHNLHVMPYLNLHLSHNRGAAFGIFAHSAEWAHHMFITLAVAISLIIVYWTRRLHKKDKWEIWSLGLILGGALGNLIDRIRFGYVVDFIDFYIGNWHWYTFNVADIGICIGAAMLFVYTLFFTK